MTKLGRNGSIDQGFDPLMGNASNSFAIDKTSVLMRKYICPVLPMGIVLAQLALQG